VDAVSTEIERGHHHLKIAVPPERTWLQVDPDRLIQILVNLLTNAARYTNPGGQIHLAAAVERDTVTIRVSDTGQGIDGPDLTRVFERFVQVGDDRHGGLGIGLALVKALVELHGGTVVAQSGGRGCGAAFQVVLPQCRVPAPESSMSEHRAAPARRVLVVDDNRDAADMLGGLLQASGHRVVIAYSGEDALRDAVGFKPHAALLDIGMSGMNGYELAARLRADHQLPDLFLVAITGWGQAEDRRRALAAGFDAHLTKPADPAQIAALFAERFLAP
jgi:CheY-like chemotaxis protein